MGFFVDDQNTLTATIPPQEGLHPGFSFRYRPALPVRIYEWRRADRATAAKDLDNDVKLLKECLVDWTIPAELTDANLRRLATPLVATLLNYVTGHVADLQESEKN